MIDALIRANLAAACAVVLVCALRLPARRWLGAESAYCLWLLPLIAACAAVAPAARIAEGSPQALLAAPAQGAALAVWIGGSALLLAWFVALQTYYARRARAGHAGPSVIGFVTPRVHMPADDAAFTERERAIIRAHEREHIARGDPAWNAVLAAVQCLFWFNPLVHLAARFMREDQELACDAATLRRHAPSRAAYAQALLKAQMQAHPMPLGASWRAGGGAHPLEVRIGELARRVPPGAVWSSIVVMTTSLTVGAFTWYVQPPVVQVAPPAGFEVMVGVIMFTGLGVIFGGLFIQAGLDGAKKEARR